MYWPFCWWIVVTLFHTFLILQKRWIVIDFMVFLCHVTRMIHPRILVHYCQNYQHTGIKRFVTACSRVRFVLSIETFSWISFLNRSDEWSVLTLLNFKCRDPFGSEVLWPFLLWSVVTLFHIKCIHPFETEVYAPFCLWSVVTFCVMSLRVLIFS